MNLWQRAKNIWNLSRFEPEKKSEKYYELPSNEVRLVAPPTPARFIPRIIKDPAKLITEEQA